MFAGKLPVVAAVIGSEAHGGQLQGGQQRPLAGNVRNGEMPSISAGAGVRTQMVSVKLAADESHLHAALPLLPQKGGTKVPLMLHAAQVRTDPIL